MSAMQTKVLIVEDEALVACDIERRLIQAGYAVPAIAASGEQALRSIEQTSPNLVLMDIHLQGPSDGIAVAAQVRDRFKIPVVFLTAYADKPTLEKAKGSGAFNYLVKPIGHVNLASTIEVALYRHRVEQEMEKREAWMQTVLDSIADAIVVTDKAGKVQLLNPTAERLTGWTSREAAGRQFWEVAQLAVGDREIADDLQAAIRAGIPLELPREARLISREGRVYLVEGQIAISRVKNQPTGTAISFRDVTARNWDEAQVRQDQKMAAAGQLANGLARDFKRLQKVVLQYSEQILLEMDPENPYRDRLQAIHRAGNRATLLASQVAGLCRKEPVEPRVVDLNPLLNQFLPMLKRLASPAIAVETGFSPELGQIRGDTGQLKQIVLNLVLNLRDGLPEGGVIRIQTNNVELPGRTPYYAGSESYIRLTIEGQGAAKPDSGAQPKLEPLIAGHKPGRGLGLAVVDAMVHAADGLICADGQPGGGPRFEVFLPRWREAEQSVQLSAPPSAAEPRRLKRATKRVEKTN